MRTLGRGGEVSSQRKVDNSTHCSMERKGGIGGNQIDQICLSGEVWRYDSWWIIVGLPSFFLLLFSVYVYVRAYQCACAWLWCVCVCVCACIIMYVCLCVCVYNLCVCVCVWPALQWRTWKLQVGIDGCRRHWLLTGCVEKRKSTWLFFCLSGIVYKNGWERGHWPLEEIDCKEVLL